MMGYVEDLRKIVGHRPLIFVGTVTVIINDVGHILLQQRQFPKGVWGLPGGLMELGESTEQVAKREVFEETALQIEDLKLINVYSGENHFIKAKNGDEFYVVTVAYYTTNVKGVIKVDAKESMKIEYFHLNDLPSEMVGSHQAIIEDFTLLHNKKVREQLGLHNEK